MAESVKSVKISYLIGWSESQNCNVGRTIDLKDIRLYMENPDRPLVGKYKWCYDWVNEKDKAKRLKEKKQTEDWKYIKEKWQMMFSEFYRETDKKYPHHKAQCDTISSLVIDIDDSITFNTFKNMYRNWTWLAYPTISNDVSGDWVKFRVVVPLAHPVKLEGENNLKVLKALRQGFCVFEDSCHNLGSYINQYDFAKMCINEGNLYCVEQSDVDVLQRIFKIKGSYVDVKIDEKNIESAVKVCNHSTFFAVWKVYNHWKSLHMEKNLLFKMLFNCSYSVKYEECKWMVCSACMEREHISFNLAYSFFIISFCDITAKT
jgi:hypothetical protein